MSAAAAAAYPSHTPLRQRRPTLTNLIKLPPFSHLPPPLHHPHRHHLLLSPTASSLRRTAASVSGEGAADQPGFDALLSVAEVLCIVPPAVCSIGWLLASVVPGGWKAFRAQPGSRVFVFQFLLLAGAVAIGGVIRRRQWRRICGVRTSSGSSASAAGVDLLARIEKVEEDMRSSGTMVRVLSRQLEKLGIRFRLTRRTLKDPIAETAALTQKNSEATRALAMQEDILEKELGEIQKVLLAMQEQQQKQLELILAIGKAGRLFDKKPGVVTEQVPKGPGNMTPGKEEVKPLEIQTGTCSRGNDRV